MKTVIRTFAERVGFEPTVQFNPYDDLANRSFRPLRHLSKIPIYKNNQFNLFLLSAGRGTSSNLSLFVKGWQKYNPKS